MSKVPINIGAIHNDSFDHIKREYSKWFAMGGINYLVRLAAGFIISPITMLLMLPGMFAYMFGLFGGMSIMSQDSSGTSATGLLLMIVGFCVYAVSMMLMSFLSMIVEKFTAYGFIRPTFDALDGEKLDFNTGVSNYTAVWKRFLAVGAWTSLWEFLWGLLFVVPGIIKGLSYFAAPYLMTEYPDMNYRDAVKKSMEITQGYKGEIFVINLIIWGYMMGIVLILGWTMIVPLAASILVFIPLKMMMNAQIYRTIRNNAVKNGMLPLPEMETSQVE